MPARRTFGLEILRWLSHQRIGQRLELPSSIRAMLLSVWPFFTMTVWGPEKSVRTTDGCGRTSWAELAAVLKTNLASVGGAKLWSGRAKLTADSTPTVSRVTAMVT